MIITIGSGTKNSDIRPEDRSAGILTGLRRHSLVLQFFIVGGVVALLGMLIVGSIVAGMIQRGVTRSAGAATALYVDGMIAPLLPDMTTGALLSDPIKRALDETLSHGALHSRVAELRLWAPDGRILYADDARLIGTRARPGSQIEEAFTGRLQAVYRPAGSVRHGRVFSGPLLTISNPVIQPWSGEVVAVAEVVEYADDLASTLSSAQFRSWIAVMGITLTFFTALGAVVVRGSYTIAQQSEDLENKLAELTSLLDENSSLRRRIQQAAQRSATLNESYLRRIGADLHDGPAQLVSLAALRLDSPTVSGCNTTGAAGNDELSSIRSHLAEALSDIRAICLGLVLPQIENADARDTVRIAIEDHERRTGHSVRSVLEENMPTLPEAHRICIYRFVQETLNNTYKHVRSATRNVTLSRNEEAVTVTVSDNGSGFDDTASHAGIGLAGLRERVQALGGIFELSTGPDGTTVRMTLDVKG